MNPSELEHFLRHHPQLYHFAEPGTSALLDIYDINGARRFRLESTKRSTTERLSKPGLPPAFIRDQHAINETILRRTLIDSITPRQWYEYLNGKVFFWAELERLNRMVNAYRCGELIVLNARRFVKAYRNRIRLSHMNSGATRSPYHYRGYTTFCRIEDYPYSRRRKKVAEVCIDVGVPDVLRYVECVGRLKGSTWKTTIYSADVGPGPHFPQQRTR